MLEISVVIPTRNRASLLGRCLASLCAQTLDPQRFEICVVDNGSKDKTAQVVALVAAHYPHHNIFRVEEPVVGTAVARNTGMTHTSSPLIAHSEDDVIMPPDWLKKFIDVFAARGSGLSKVGGEMTPLWGAAPPDWLSADMLPMLGASTGINGAARLVDVALSTGNGCYRREALAAVGNFPARLGRKGNNLLSGENAVDLALHKEGGQLLYDPSLTVAHTITADRLQAAWLRRRAFWQGISDYAVSVYLQSKRIAASDAPQTDLPLGGEYWGFINNAAQAPTMEGLARLRGLGYTLAHAGFIPV